MILHARKHHFSTVIHTLCALSILACGGKERARAGGAAPFRVGLLTTGPVSDQAWNAGAYRGLQAIRDSLGADVSNVQT